MASSHARGRGPARPRETPPPLAVSPEVAAEMIGIGRARLYQKLATGEIRSYKDGSLRRIPVKSLHSYMDAQLAISGARNGSA
jgi:excisionase family DNA binding protein